MMIVQQRLPLIDKLRGFAVLGMIAIALMFFIVIWFESKCISQIRIPSIITHYDHSATIPNANLLCRKIQKITIRINRGKSSLPSHAPGYLQKAMDCEVHDYLLKDEPIDYLIETIRKVMNGEKVVSRDLAATLFMKEQNPLNEREIAVLQLVKEGLSTNEISKKLFLTKGTIRNYLSTSIQKLYVESRQQAAQVASDKGWL